MVTEEEKDCGRKKAKSRSEGTGLERVDGWVQKSIITLSRLRSPPRL